MSLYHQFEIRHVLQNSGYNRLIFLSFEFTRIGCTYLLIFFVLDSENYIFGKFDAFCKRLENIADMATTLEALSALQLMKVEGIEKIHVRYQTIVNSIKSKAYNVLDHRNVEVHPMSWSRHYLFFLKC